MNYLESIILIFGCIISTICIGRIPVESIHFFDVVILIVAMAINLVFSVNSCMEILIKFPYKKIVSLGSFALIGAGAGIQIATSDHSVIGGLTRD